MHQTKSHGTHRVTEHLRHSNRPFSLLQCYVAQTSSAHLSYIQMHLTAVLEQYLVNEMTMVYSTQQHILATGYCPVKSIITILLKRECLAINLATSAFRVYLLGKPFVIETDHRSLQWLDQLKEKKCSTHSLESLSTAL